MSFDPWKPCALNGGYMALYLPEGQHTWRSIRLPGGKPQIFPTASAALTAARDKWFDLLRGKITSTRPMDKFAERLAGEADAWLQQRRADIKATHKLARKGGKVVIVMSGRARA